MAGAPELGDFHKNAFVLLVVHKEKLWGVIDGGVHLGSGPQGEVKIQSSQTAVSLGEAAALPNHSFSAFSYNTSASELELEAKIFTWK